MWTGQTAVFYGDSITAGVGASNNAHRWTSLLCAAMNGTEDNKGVSGMALQDSLSVCRTVFDATAVIAKQSFHNYIFIAFGTNDIGSNWTGSTPPNFKEDYQTKIDIVKSKGWQAPSIVLLAPYWWDGYAQTVPGLSGCMVPVATTVSRHESFVKACKNLAHENGCIFADVYTPERDTPNHDSLLYDGLHPNDAGHLFLANFMSSFSYVPETALIPYNTILVAKNSVSFADAGINSKNTAIIYCLNGNVKSYVPGRDINGITSFEQGKSYYCVTNAEFDYGNNVLASL